MGREIERKFLVKSDIYRQLSEGILYRQGYLSTNSACVMRIRLCNKKGYVTIKSKTVGITRSEYEYEIPYEEANEIIDTLCLQPIIEKVRYKIRHGDFVWEVDEFKGDNEGLVVAEIELNDENTEFHIPRWIGAEVSGDPRYHNSNLVKNPYKNWK